MCCSFHAGLWRLGTPDLQLHSGKTSSQIPASRGREFFAALLDGEMKLVEKLCIPRHTRCPWLAEEVSVWKLEQTAVPFSPSESIENVRSFLEAERLPYTARKVNWKKTRIRPRLSPAAFEKSRARFNSLA